MKTWQFLALLAEINILQALNAKTSAGYWLFWAAAVLLALSSLMYGAMRELVKGLEGEN